MVLENPQKVNESLIPDFTTKSKQDTIKQVFDSEYVYSDEVCKILKDFEEKVVPEMIGLGWMEKVAKSTEKPFYNDMEQSLNAHILPGVELMANIVTIAEDIEEHYLRDLISLWTIHDIHKLIKKHYTKEFDISFETVEEWVTKLNLMDFKGTSDLTIEDFHSCAVALHDSENSNIDDSTILFTTYRPYLKLVDALMSISDISEYDDSFRSVSAVFDTVEKSYVPSSHKVNFEDDVITKIVNKTIHEKLTSINGVTSIDVRNNGVLYIKEDSIDYPQAEVLIETIIDGFITNLKDSYQKYRNSAFLGSDIESINNSNAEYGVMPTVYEIPKIAKLCLTKTEQIQRIVQAAVEQQNRPFSLSKDSINQIEQIEKETNELIPKSPYIEGMAALVHTVYKEILPEYVSNNNPKVFEKTLESAIIHVFGVSYETQEQIAKLLETNANTKSLTSFPYKYLIAKDVNERYKSLTKKERQKELIQLISERLQDFTDWDANTNTDTEKIKEELYLQFAKRVWIDGEKLIEHGLPGFLNRVESATMNNTCSICNEPTTQEGNNPELLTTKDFNLLDIPFITENNTNKLEKLDLSNTIPTKSLCVNCQLSLTLRTPQYRKFVEQKENTIHVSVTPIESNSVATYYRFNKIYEYISTEIKSGNLNAISLSNIKEPYKDIIENSLEKESGLQSFTDRNRLFSIGMDLDQTSSKITFPTQSEEEEIYTILSLIVASLVSGIKITITKNPQLYVTSEQNTNLVTFGPEMKLYKNILGSKTSIIQLPTKIKLFTQLLKLCEHTNNPKKVIETYTNLSEKPILAGSRIYSKIENTFVTNEQKQNAARIAISIDAIVSENNVYANDILINTRKIGKLVAEIVPENNPMLIKSVLMISYDVLETTKYNKTTELHAELLESLAHISELNIEYKQLKPNGKAYKYADAIIDVYNMIGKSNRSSFTSIRRPIIDGSLTRAVIYNKEE